jgi:hydrogenase expression/formation protein HypC
MCLAIPGRIVELVPGPEQWAVVDVVGLRRRVDISLVREEGAIPGDWVLIHVGFAMSKISEEAASEQMRMLEIMGESASALEEIQGYGGIGSPPDVWPGSPPDS